MSIKSFYLLGILVLVTGLFIYGKPLYYNIRYPATPEIIQSYIDVYVEPAQEITTKEPFSFTNRRGGKVTLIPVATYDIQARIIINQRYPNFWNVGQGLEDLLTNDLVLVWGKLAEDKYLKRIKFSHQWTYMTFSYRDDELNRDPGFEYILNHASSNHLIAANRNIDYALRQLQKNDFIRTKGYLVNIQVAGQELIKTSTVRTDNWRPGQGNTGGSEFIYVTELQNLDRLYK